MNENPRRGWFRFSLRTLFVTMTVLCCWLGWESSIVRQRQTVLNEMRTGAAFHVTPADDYLQRYPAGASVPSAARVPLVRGWLGDKAIQEIWYTPHIQAVSEAELARVTRTFPEAEIRESFPEPCHPGCFPRGTLVDTPRGPQAIESIQPGDQVTAILPGGDTAQAKVRSVFVTDNRLWKVVTEASVLFTTQTQPLCVTSDSTRPAGELQSGDSILCLANGEVRAVKVLSANSAGRTEKVFNVVLGDSEIFVAGGFLARGKPPAAIAAQ